MREYYDGIEICNWIKKRPKVLGIYLDDIENSIREDFGDQQRTLQDILHDLLTDAFSDADNYPKVEEVDGLLSDKDEKSKNIVKKVAYEYSQRIDIIRFYIEQFDKRDEFFLSLAKSDASDTI